MKNYNLNLCFFDRVRVNFYICTDVYLLMVAFSQKCIVVITETNRTQYGRRRQGARCMRFHYVGVVNHQISFSHSTRYRRYFHKNHNKNDNNIKYRHNR